MTDTSKAKSRALRVASVVALTVVVVAPAAASWHGLVATGRDVFGLRDGWEYLVPLTLDGAAFYAAALAMRAILAGDSAFGPRLLTAGYAVTAAAFQAHHAANFGGSLMSAAYFAGASLSAVVLWDVTLRALRRDQLRAAGLIEAPLPRWRLLRWLVAPIETARAWRLAVVEQITDPAEALRLARAASKSPIRRALAERITDAPALPASTTENEGETNGNQDGPADSEGSRLAGNAAVAVDRGSRGDVRGEEPQRGRDSGQDGSGLVHDGRGRADGVRTPDLRGLTSKKAAVHAAFDYLGRKDVPAALELLSEQGITVDRSYAYTVAWTPPLRAVGGGDIK